MDSESLKEFVIEDISTGTIPHDFNRSKHIHNCWRIAHQGSVKERKRCMRAFPECGRLQDNHESVNGREHEEAIKKHKDQEKRNCTGYPSVFQTLDEQLEFLKKQDRVDAAYVM